jgi:hypothetical protein
VKRAAALVLLASALLGATAAYGGQAHRYRRCGEVRTPYLIGSSVETVGAHFACSNAQQIMRLYFKRVGETSESIGGCAEIRATKGCKIRQYRCFTRYVPVANELEGVCRGPEGRVLFVEKDIGPH